MRRYFLPGRIFLLFFPLVHCVTASAQETDQKIRIPPGQRVVKNFPLLHYTNIPDLDRARWHLKISGVVGERLDLGWEAFSRIPAIESVSDFHCVTGWTKLDNHWTGVRIRDLLAMAGLKPAARYITFKGADGYTTSLPISACMGDDDILATHLEGQLIETSRGGPVRVVIPEKYGYKSSLWVTELVLTRKQEMGLWEKQGYSNSADPWKEERFDMKGGH